MRLSKSVVVSHLKQNLSEDKFWNRYLRQTTKPTFHLAIFRQPYLRFILDGKKTIETRFSKVACAPYGKVSKGDILLLKQSGAPTANICVVRQAWFYALQPDSLSLIKEKFGQSICPANDSFWEDRKHAVYATLILIDKVASIPNLPLKKRDRRGWVVIKDEAK